MKMVTCLVARGTRKANSHSELVSSFLLIANINKVSKRWYSEMIFRKTLVFSKQKSILPYADCGSSEEVYVYKQGEEIGVC